MLITLHHPVQHVARAHRALASLPGVVEGSGARPRCVLALRPSVAPMPTLFGGTATDICWTNADATGRKPTTRYLCPRST